jgi:photosystem II stability/assembly factor-like uncharacterized protein
MKNRLLLTTSMLVFLMIASLYILNGSGVLQPTETRKRMPSRARKVAVLDEERPAAQQGKLVKTTRIEGEGKKDSPQLFARYHALIRTLPGKEKPDYPPNYKMIELTKAKERAKVGLTKPASKLNWIERGPGNASGRTRAIIVDPDDPSHNTWFAGSVSGGIWKTTDAGQSWTELTRDLPNLAFSTMAMAASNHNIIYAGTGEGFFNVDGVRGDGIFKSTDRGQTWAQLSATTGNWDFAWVNRLVVDPSDENVVLTATGNGIYRSTDGGATWTEVYWGVIYPIQQIVANPQNFSTLYATRNGYGFASSLILKSTDGGVTWYSLSTSMAVYGRIEVAIAPSDTSRIYALAEKDWGGPSVLYVSNDAGASWQPLQEESGEEPNVFSLGGGNQGWYDNAITVHPFSPDTVFAGGPLLWKIAILRDSTKNQIIDVKENNTETFLSFVNRDLPFARGGLGTGDDFHDLATQNGTTEDDFVSVEIRFGPGKSQKAHRFFFGAGWQYSYQNYVDVPFEVWDVTNNRQLMASFRDWEKDGGFDLIEWDVNNIQREYLFIHAVPYDSDNPGFNIAQTAGQTYKNIYALWPILADSAVWDPENLPESNLRITFGAVPIKIKSTKKLTVWPLASELQHPDHHNITVIPIDQTTNRFRIVNGNDGGVYYSDDGGTTWMNTLNGYNTTQFYGADKKPGAHVYIGGTQDNGTWLSPENPQANSEWAEVVGGDGFEVSWHYVQLNKILASVQYNSIRKSLDGGQTWFRATNGLDDVGGVSGQFITNIAKSPSDPDLVFTIGESGVWRSDNFADDWFLSPIPENWGFNGSTGRVKISLANPQIVWAGYKMTGSAPVYVSTDGGLAFAPTNVFEDVELGIISGVATHPLRDSTAYVLFSVSGRPKILRTLDLGQTWEDLSGFGTNFESSNGFPDVAVYSLLVMPHNPGEIWAGTEIGLFISTDNGATWSFANNGLSAVAIWDMKVVDDQVVVATHGRGIWSVTIPELLNVPRPKVTLSPRLNWVVVSPTGIMRIDLSLRSSYDSTFVRIDGSKAFVFTNTVAAKDTTVNYPITVAEEKTMVVSVTSYKDGASFQSAPRSVLVFPAVAPRVSYLTDLNDTTRAKDFVGIGFAITTENGFKNAAIHSLHPYPEETDLIYQLRIPITVASTKATLKYEDIAIVETGESGSKFGDPDFYDYVVVEGTKDGLNWKPLADGYDASFNEAWLSAYNAGNAGSSDLFVQHEINLMKTFSPGDIIFIRFRLFSDPLVTDWGWAIDNIAIQQEATSVKADRGVPTAFGLSQNYPNPFNPNTTIEFAVPVQTKVTLKVYDLMGREVETLADKVYLPGFHRVNWQPRGLASGVYFYRMQAGNFVQRKELMLLK